jgi:uncharacterized protein
MNELWLLSDGAAGNIKQAIALAEALARSYRQMDLSWQGLDRWLAPQFKAAQFAAFAQHTAPWPELAIGCGRLGAAALLALKRRSAQTKTVQILHPRVAASRFDAVICPQHDQLKGANVIATIGGLHQINPATLAAARLAAAREQSVAAAAPTPLRLLLIGAPTQHAPYTISALQALCAELQTQPGALSISVSRRTPTVIKQLLNRCGLPFFDPAQNRESNPYLRWLAHAQQIIVTPDSINMISEAIATPASVHVPWQDQVRGKFQLFFNQIDARLSSDINDIASKTAIIDMDQVVSRLRKLLSI